jgi:ribose transport system permease protein
MKKIVGILSLLVLVCVVTTIINPVFLRTINVQNTIRWTGLFGIISIGAAFVIICGGIDLSIGSVICLVGSLLPYMLVTKGISVPMALTFVIVLSLLIGLFHGLLITKMRMQPFVVTLCGLLFYRGFARWITKDQTMGFGSAFDGLRKLTTSNPFSIPIPGLNFVYEGNWSRWKWDHRADEYAMDANGNPIALEFFGWVGIPMPLIILIVLAIISYIFLNKTIYGRYMLAIGRNEDAARYSGISTDQMVILSYVICSLLSGIGGVLFALDVNSVSPAMFGNFYELYAIAAAVLGGCSLRGGEGSIAGVVIGAALMRVLYNAINLLKIPTTLEFSIIGLVILLGVMGDELAKRVAAKRRRMRQALEMAAAAEVEAVAAGVASDDSES